MINEIVASYRALGWATIRVEPCAKRPIGSGWEQRIDPPEAFSPGDNVGVRLGQPSGGLVDVDLDCAESVMLAPLFLPPTATFGRASKPRSHWLYRTATTTRKPPRTQTELRSTGGQTVFPGSIHESGESIVWNDWPPEGGPLALAEADLLGAFGRLSAATVVARCWPEAQRHHDAHHITLALAGALWHAGWSETEARDLILPAAELTGGPDSGHREAAIADTFDDHDRGRWGFPKLADFIGPLDAKAIERMVELVPAVPRHMLAAGEEIGALTDLGNAERFFADHGDDLRHVRGLGWMQWDGTAWRVGYEPMGLIVRSVRKLQRYGVEQNDAPVIKWAIKSESAGKLSAIESLAEKLDNRTEVDHLDSDPWLLNVPNGTVDLRTGELRPHNRADLCTKVAGVEYDPSARAPRFERFLVEVFEDPEIVMYMLRYLGSALTAVTRDQVLQLWYGTGANGKSTLVELLLHVLGDYGQKMASELLTTTTRQSSAASPDVARMLGTRFTAGVETSEGKRWNEVLVKELTGGDRIVARHLHQDLIEFSPTWKIALAVNHKPIVRGTDHGIWRRIHLVPFQRRFEGAAKDVHLLDHLRDTEGPGVLTLLVQGCIAWQQYGLSPPGQVLAAVSEYRAGQDTIGAFLTECVEKDERSTVPRSNLYRAYRSWCIEGGEYCHSKQTFSRILIERGLTARKTKGQIQWIGLRLRSIDF